jgi:hypothetical protein
MTRATSVRAHEARSTGSACRSVALQVPAGETLDTSLDDADDALRLLRPPPDTDGRVLVRRAGAPLATVIRRPAAPGAAVARQVVAASSTAGNERPLEQRKARRPRARGPPLVDQLVAPMRRDGGLLGGGRRRAGRARMSSVVTSAMRSTASSKAASDPFGAVRVPLTFRTYCRAASSISSGVAGGCRPRSVVMLRHIGRTSSIERRGPLPIASSGNR